MSRVTSSGRRASPNPGPDPLHISLTWDGPIGIGRFPADAALLDELMQPGVYLRIKSYDNGRTVSYVGQSKTVIARVDQHLTALVGLQQPLRDGQGRVVSRGDAADRIAAYNDIDRALAIVLAEAKRTSFYYALCDDAFDSAHLNLVEGVLKSRLEETVRGRAGLVDCENQQGVPGASFEDVVAIENDFYELGPEASALLRTLLGDGPIELAESAFGLGHAE